MTARETTQRMFDAWNNRDWGTIRSALHPECIYTGPDGQQARGIEDCLAVACWPQGFESIAETV